MRTDGSGKAARGGKEEAETARRTGLREVNLHRLSIGHAARECLLAVGDVHAHASLRPRRWQAPCPGISTVIGPFRNTTCTGVLDFTPCSGSDPSDAGGRSPARSRHFPLVPERRNETSHAARRLHDLERRESHPGAARP